MSCDDAIVADNTSIHNGTVNTDEAIVANCAAVNSAMMSDGAVRPNVGARGISDMDHGEILNVCICADNNFTGF